MSDQMSPRDRSTDPGQPTASGVAAGFILFAVILMIMIGVFQALSGLVAILNNALYTVTDSYPLRLNRPTWGWIDLIVGLLVATPAGPCSRAGPGVGWWGSFWLRSVLSLISCSSLTTLSERS
jgi:hypothetical protein